MQVGISAPQGCGKTTLVTELEKLLGHEGLPCAVVSVDDFYLTHADQTSLAQTHQDNWLLQGRGHAGTHDVALGTKTLQGLAASRCRPLTALLLWSSALFFLCAQKGVMRSLWVCTCHILDTRCGIESLIALKNPKHW